ARRVTSTRAMKGIILMSLCVARSCPPDCPTSTPAMRGLLSPGCKTPPETKSPIGVQGYEWSRALKFPARRDIDELWWSRNKSGDPLGLADHQHRVAGVVHDLARGGADQAVEA